MSDLTHFKKLRDPNFLGSWDLVVGANEKGEPTFKELVLVIDYAMQEEVIDLQSKNSAKKSVTTLHFKNAKPMILNSGNAKATANVCGSPFIEYWKGKSITVYVEKIKAFGDYYDALRIRPFAPVAPKTYTCADCGIDNVPENMAIRTQKAFGVHLCVECGKKRSELKKEENDNAE